MSNLIITAGIILLSLGAFMKYQEVSGKTEPKANSNLISQEEVKPVVEESSTTDNSLKVEQPTITDLPVIETPIKEAVEISHESDSQLSQEEKGVQFESFIVKKFDRKHFTVKEWRSDKFVEGVYADSNMLPDMELELRTNNNIFRFAVECKWRNRFFKDHFELKDQNLKNYRNFQKNKNIPVYIVLGIGGKPSLPDLMYVVPLRDIKDNTISRSELKKYIFEDVKKDFYYDVKNCILECRYY